MKKTSLSLLLCCLAFQACGQSPTVNSTVGPVEKTTTAGWPVWGGNDKGTRFSPLTQITAENVDQLELAWEYHTGDSADLNDNIERTAFQATPILHNNTLFFCSGLSRAFAIDAETGKERWVYDSKPDMRDIWSGNCRGVALWSVNQNPNSYSKNKKQTTCSTRVFLGTMDSRLIAIDGDTGLACQDFGSDGQIDLRYGMGKVARGEMYMTSPATVVGDMVIQGALVWDNQRIDSPSGVIRAWDVRTGELRWAFDPVPPNTPLPKHNKKYLQLQAQELEDSDKNPDHTIPDYYYGTPNSWGVASVDTERNLIFIPFGGAGPDFIGGHRKRYGFDLDYYANSIVALDTRTGKVAWHFQTVHHDLWDYDIAAQPVLFEFEKDGQTIPALVQATKVGHLFLLNRETGEPIFPVEERAVPQTSILGEYTSATQPFPTFPKPLHPYGLTEDDAWGFTFYDRNACKKKIAVADKRGIFTPPTLNQYSIQYPGVAGGQNWGGLSYDKNHNLLIMPQNHVVTYNKLLPREEKSETGTTDEYLGYTPNYGSPYVVQHEILLSPFGSPCTKPPWGTLMAVSLDSGEKVWEIPFGTTQDMMPSWLSWLPISLNLGLPSAGGPVVTETGLVFIAAALDNYIRAFDVKTGEKVWEQRLPAGGQATPMTYSLKTKNPKNGKITNKQFVVIAAGGHASMRTKLGDSVMAFSLPD